MSLKPSYTDMWKPLQVKSVIQRTMKEFMEAKSYDQNEVASWTKELATNIRNQLKALECPRYKHLVQVVIGENRGEGVRMGCRCLWDSETDRVAEETLVTESLFVVAVAFGVYTY